MATLSITILNARLSTVVDEEVGGVRRNARDDAVKGVAGDVVAQAIDANTETKEVGGNTSNVGGGHGGTRDGVGLATGPGAGDVGTGGKNIDQAAEVGVVGEGVVNLGSTNGAGRGLGSRGGGRGVSTLVTGSNSQEDAGVDNSGSGRVHGARGAATERHVDNNAVGAALRGSIVDDKLHTSDDARVGASAVVTEDLDSKEGGLLSNTVGGAADSAGNVGTVALAISVVVVGVVGQEGSTALEIRVRGVDTLRG